MARTNRWFGWALIGLSLLLTGVHDVYAKQATVTTLASSPSPSKVGDAVTFTATVSSQQSGQSNQHCPDGVVQFQVNGANYGSPVQVTPLRVCNIQGGIASASASITVTFQTAGSYTVVALYGGDHDFTSGVSQAYTQTVGGQPTPITTTTKIFSSGNPSVVGQPVTLTAVVTPAEWGFGVPSGTVTFTMGSTTLFIGTLTPDGWTEFTTSSLPEGANTITATYGGNNVFSGSVGTAVQAATARSKSATSIALAASPTSAILGETVWLTATVTPVEFVFGVPTGTVTFSSGNMAIIGTLSEDGWVTVSVSSLPLGANSITATYGGDANYSTSSATVTELVNAPSAIPTAIELVVAPPTSAGGPVWITATVTPAQWTFGDPTGTVAIMLTNAQGGKSTLFSGALPPTGWVEFTALALPLGANSITATYSGDANYRASVSAAVTAQVGPASGKIPTQVALVASPSTTVAGAPVWLSATVTPAEWSFGNPTGTVTFTSGNVTITGALSTGQSADWVTVATSALPQGTHTITATYNGDANYGSSSATVVVTVNSLGIGTTIALVSSPNPSNFGEPVTITATVVPSLWGYGTPPGPVTLSTGSMTLTDTLVDGWVVFLTSALPQGATAITTTYGGSNIFKGSTATVTQTVNAPTAR